MATFIYKGLKTGGGEVEGRISAADEVDALRQLEAQCIAAFQIHESRLTDISSKSCKSMFSRPTDNQIYKNAPIPENG